MLLLRVVFQLFKDIVTVEGQEEYRRCCLCMKRLFIFARKVDFAFIERKKGNHMGKSLFVNRNDGALV